MSLYFQLPLQGVWVRSRVRELRFHMPLRPEEKKKNRKRKGKKRQNNYSYIRVKSTGVWCVCMVVQVVLYAVS